MIKTFYSAIPRINAVLIVSGLLLGSYLLMSMSRPYQVGSLDEKAMSVKPGISAATALSALPQFNIDAFKKSELFRSSGKKTAAQSPVAFVLLGVSMGEKKLAILRDAKANKDYYCTEGDIVLEYTVRSISRDKVILAFDDTTLEITR